MIELREQGRKMLVKYKFVIAIFAFILVAFLINTLHTQFPDEFDNIYGGFLITQGKLPYTGFFTHHNPGAYYLASLIIPFTGRSFVNFRLVFALLLFLALLASYFLLQKRLKGTSLNFFLLYGFLLAVGATFWWGHMLLSETIVGYALVPVLLLIIIKKLEKIKFDLFDLCLVSVLTFLAIFTSLTYVYFVPFIDLIVLYFYFLNSRPFILQKIFKPIFIFALPYGLFFLYLLVTRSLFEFYFASIYYNVAYYIYNFPLVAGTFSHHPLRYAISLAKNAFDHFYALMVQVRDFNFAYPVNIALGLVDFGFLIYLLLRKQLALLVLVLSMMVFANARSSPLTLGETDFHATVYIMLTLALGAFLFFRLKEELEGKLGDAERLILNTIFILGGIYWFFGSFHLTYKFVDKAYGKFMGRDPLIYDWSQTGPVINLLVSKNDYYWMGPFELQELLFIKGKIASKYYWFLPASSRDEKIKRELIIDLTKNRPKVIIFKKWWANFGVRPEDFNTVIVKFLDDNYFQLADFKKEGLNVRFTRARERDFDFETELFFDKNRKTEIMDDLFRTGLLEKI